MLQRRIVLVGGLGKTGRRIHDRLRARAVNAVGVSRSTRLRFDWRDTTTWPAALRGATAAYVTHQPGLAEPGAADDIALFASMAAEMGVEHVVMLSIHGGRSALRAEERLRRAPLDHTILRASWLADNFAEGPLREEIIAGEVPLPGDLREPFVSADDIADAAVEALCDPAHLNQTYAITGPRAVRLSDALTEIAAASGLTIRWRSSAAEDDGATGPLPSFAGRRRGRSARVADDLERILGRKGLDFADYVRRAGAEGAWVR
jgi:uncharacterized protein YbjT (DUF2867 family)